MPLKVCADFMYYDSCAFWHVPLPVVATVGLQGIYIVSLYARHKLKQITAVLFIQGIS